MFYRAMCYDDGKVIKPFAHDADKLRENIDVLQRRREWILMPSEWSFRFRV